MGNLVTKTKNPSRGGREAKTHRKPYVRTGNYVRKYESRGNVEQIYCFIYFMK